MIKHKKQSLVFILLFLSTWCFSQIELNKKDFKQLIKLSEYYAKNSTLQDKSTIKHLEKFRSEKLSNIIDLLKVFSLRDNGFLDKRYLFKPSYDDLVIWYTLREIRHNAGAIQNGEKQSIEIIKRVVQEQIDKRWLIDNYYAGIGNQILMTIVHDSPNLSNLNFDLSDLNFDLNDYGLETEFEKSSFFLNLVNPFIVMFNVLSSQKEYTKLLSVANKMPMFNGKKYFYYQEFNYLDFEWKTIVRSESYKKTRLSNLYLGIIEHMKAENKINGEKSSLKIYSNSIMSKQKYFKYPYLYISRDLKELYKTKKTYLNNNR
ncbi:hypothetical protein [Aquimarina megaterium]|uniref:hypothetical protein n=1 Tax=Aquimarina megaterium TaxID=1443666 RepID=UPI000470A22A|nr:hypothetical protein [Aquimarina megaterium]